MYAKHLIAFAIAAMILFSSSVPVYASHIKKMEPTADEKRLFEKIFARLNVHASMMQVPIDDVKKSLSEAVKIFFSCRSLNYKDVDTVSVSVSTQFASFDPSLAEKHKTGILSGLYVWDCKAVKDRYSLTIECVNTLMLNPDFLSKEEVETNERKIIAMAENEMVLYHEFLHAELMIDAMKDVSDGSGWRKNACNFFADNNNELDYAPSDGDHKIISTLELDFLAKLIEQKNGMMVTKTIDRKSVGSGEFEQVVATFDELGVIAKNPFYVFARAVNIEDVEILVSAEKETIAISGYLRDAGSDGIARLFVIPRTTFSSVKIELSVDDALKSKGSEFVFTARVQNQQDSYVSGVIRLGIDGMVVASQEVDLPANSEKKITFTWKSNDVIPAKHVAAIDGFDNASNEVTVFTFDKLESKTVRSSGTVADRAIIDPDTNEIISIVRPNRITAMIIAGSNDDNIEVQLMAPHGTTVIGKNALVIDVGSRVNIVKVNGQTLAVKYTELNERLLFFAVKTTVSDLPLPSGEWSIKTIGSDGNDADTRIKYYVNYVV